MNTVVVVVTQAPLTSNSRTVFTEQFPSILRSKASFLFYFLMNLNTQLLMFLHLYLLLLYYSEDRGLSH